MVCPIVGGRCSNKVISGGHVVLQFRSFFFVTCPFFSTSCHFFFVLPVTPYWSQSSRDTLALTPKLGCYLREGLEVFVVVHSKTREIHLVALVPVVPGPLGNLPSLVMWLVTTLSFARALWRVGIAALLFLIIAHPSFNISLQAEGGTESPNSFPIVYSPPPSICLPPVESGCAIIARPR
ncbi:hypothetical protein F5X96DRAFT_243801 [Biscogniauxia mediterranea]|nr:hypothetical protein F5X96DRAFT_243801 [Biscogniauxia mediterranea]